MTHYVQIVQAQRPFDADGWTPWRNCDGMSLEQTAVMALRKFLREAGYEHRHFGARPEFEPFEVMVYVADDKTPRHVNGRLAACHGFKMRISPGISSSC